MTALHSCAVCVHKRMLGKRDAWWPSLVAGMWNRALAAIPVCERHEPELVETARKYGQAPRCGRGWELYPQGVDT